MVSMGRKPTGLRDALKRTAARLFYLQGYPSTGLSQLVEEAGTNKTSLYQYYASKEELGIEYVREISRFLLLRIERLMKQSKGPDEFFKRLVRLIVSDIESQESFNACPVAGFAYQIGAGQPLQAVVQETASGWLESFRRYYDGLVQSGLMKKKNTSMLARQTLLIYQGGMAGWRLTGDVKLIQETEGMYRLLLLSE